MQERSAETSRSVETGERRRETMGRERCGGLRKPKERAQSVQKRSKHVRELPSSILDPRVHREHGEGAGEKEAASLPQ
eukprot:7465106-Pyramimonas_sp.AAC.1